MCHILDIFHLVDGPNVVKDPFTTINTIYVKDINGRTDCFLQNTEPYENANNEERVDHTLTITLLPHQIIIFPATIYDNMNESDISQMRFYGNDDIR